MRLVKKAAGPFKLGLLRRSPSLWGGLWRRYQVPPPIRAFTTNFAFRETWSRAPKFLTDRSARDSLADQDFVPRAF
jgi:hypothetical protein